MTDKTHKFSTHFTIRSYEVGSNQKTGISTVANLFQESAGLHAKKLNFDITDLYNLGLTWILYKMHIKITKYPKRWDNVVVETWPSTGKDIRAFRSYEMKDENGHLLAKALGQWMVLDIEKRRPKRIPEQLSRFPLLRQSGTKLDSGKKYIEPLEAKESNLITTVSRYDLDMNSHVNSVKYIDWSTGYQAEKSNNDCDELVIQHQSEAYYGEKIYRASVNYGDHEKITLFKEDGKAISTAIVYYR